MNTCTRTPTPPYLSGCFQAFSDFDPIFPRKNETEHFGEYSHLHLDRLKGRTWVVDPRQHKVWHYHQFRWNIVSRVNDVECRTASHILLKILYEYIMCSD